MIITTKLDGYQAGIRLYPFKDSPAPAPVPDPAAVSAAQTQSNTETARLNAQLNRVNQVTPYGNLTYSRGGAPTFNQSGYDAALKAYNDQQSAQQSNANNAFSGASIYAGEGGDPTPTTPPTSAPTNTGGLQAPTREQFMTGQGDDWTARIELSPEQQSLLDSDNRIKAQLGQTAEQGLNRVNSAMNTPFDVSQLSGYRATPQGGGAPTGGGAQAYSPAAGNYITGLNGGKIQTSLPNSDYAAQRTSVEDAIYSRVNPQLQRDRSALDQRLANQGIVPGSEAYTNAIDENNRAATDARYQAVLAGGQEQSRLAGLDLAAGNFANSAQSQDFGQQAANASLNNSVQDTRFNQGLQTTNQNNQANQQNYAQQLSSNQQDFAQQLAASQQNNAQRQQQLQEQAYLRSLPLNELNSLRTGSQVTNPSFSATPQTNVANTNTSGDIWNSFNANNANVSNQTAATNSNNQATTAAAMAAIAAF